MTLILLAFGQAAAAADAPSLVDAFAWLEGDWVRQTSRGDEAVESWKLVSENTMEGIVSVTSDGSTRVSEHLRIESMGDDVFYVARPGENPYPTPFKLIEFDEIRFAFENPNHDFPQRIIYMRSGESDLHVRIEGPIDGETRSVDFKFKKKK